jgi:predicted dehydrogenase
MGLWAKDIVKAPEKALVYAANTFPEKRARETFDTMTVSFPYSDVVITYDVTAGLQRGPWDRLYGIAFIGNNATIVTDRSKLNVYPEWDNKSKKNRAEEYVFDQGKESHGEHVRNFLDCIKSGNKPACPPELGRVAAMHVHIANIAGRVGEPMLLWDDEKKQFSNSKAANEFITPVYRAPWTLPKF